ncbi:hypothetical protein, partial [Sinisalibacter aestuarii]|uniref:hypothetical protein n=1 Tax=Sinisalibacter aestuarii TaxID=2949426 RepID=UPI0024903DBE
VFRFSGFPVFRFSGFPVFRFSGFPVFRFSGFPVFRFSGFPVKPKSGQGAASSAFCPGHLLPRGGQGKTPRTKRGAQHSRDQGRDQEPGS